jgi:hypothetical protein
MVGNLRPTHYWRGHKIIPRSQAEAMMQGMTDPLAIRMVKEVIEFAYSRPTTVSIDALRTELRNLCLAKKIFVQ